MAKAKSTKLTDRFTLVSGLRARYTAKESTLKRMAPSMKESSNSTKHTATASLSASTSSMRDPSKTTNSKAMESKRATPTASKGNTKQATKLKECSSGKQIKINTNTEDSSTQKANSMAKVLSI